MFPAVFPHVNPPIRAPRPVLAGNIRDIALTGGIGQSWPLGRPVIGTAWALTQFTVTLVGPAPVVSEDILFKLLLGGEVLATFGHVAVTSPDNNNVYPITMTQEFTNPILVFDTDSLMLQQAFNMTPTNPPNYVDIRYSARLGYA